MARQSPLDSMESWLQGMSEQFETAAESWGSGLETWPGGMEQPPVDMVGTDEEYVITAEVPGYEKEDIDVHVTDGTLAIDAESTEEMAVQEGSVMKKERTHESVSRRLGLPGDADTDAVSASLQHGLLTVTIARTEPLEEGHRIDID